MTTSIDSGLTIGLLAERIDAVDSLVTYCRPDLTDLLRDILGDIECHYRNSILIAEQGHCEWLGWSRDVRAVIRRGFAPLYERFPPL
jgi:hypothetical protein